MEFLTGHQILALLLADMVTQQEQIYALRRDESLVNMDLFCGINSAQNQSINKSGIFSNMSKYWDQKTRRIEKEFKVTSFSQFWNSATRRTRVSPEAELGERFLFGNMVGRVLIEYFY